MRFATVRELSQSPSKYIDLKESVVITKHGKPVRALVPLMEDDLEDFILAERLGLEKEAGKATAASQKKKNLNITSLLKKL